MTRHHVARVEAHPDGDRRLAGADLLAVESVDLMHHGQRGVQRPLGVVVHRVRGSEDDQHAVALELIDVAAMVQDDPDHSLEVVVQEADQLLGLHALRQG